MKVFRTDTIPDIAYEEIVSVLRSGGVIGFPTDTAYGLGGDPYNTVALDRIFEIKQRPESKPLLLLVDSLTMAESVSRPPRSFYRVAEKFWPGPLSVVLPAVSSLSSKLTSGTETIAVRWPVARFATTLLRHFGVPITATSANRSGRPSTVTADEVRAQLGESLDALIDGGTLPERGGSTLVDLTADQPVLLREGPISFTALNEFFEGRLRSRVS